MSTSIAPGSWTLDPASSVGFKAKLILGLTVKGRFTKHESEIVVGQSPAESSVAVTVHTDSVDTGMPKRDEHLRADSMIASTAFPTLRFRSTAVAQTQTGVSITGDLTIRGITRPVTIDLVNAQDSSQPRYTGQLVISPKDYGIVRKGVTKPLTILIDATLTPSAVADESA